VSWLPVNHDMGLIEGVLQPAYSGFPAYLMAPAAFLQRPARWLQAISRLRATQSGGPNFAYDLCVRRVTESDRRSLDLSAWRIAFNGSEPVRRSTLESFQRTFGECGFRWNAFRAAYGLAESTLLVTSSPSGEEPVCLEVDRSMLKAGRVLVRESGPDRRDNPQDGTPLVASGSPAGGARVVIVDPQRRTLCAADRIGEIWVAGASVARGYWGRPQETTDAFQAFLESGDGPFLRTGDLGFLRGRHLFVTGRIKDVLIVRGQKHYPQDLELTAERAASSLRPGCCAAFAIDCRGEERAAIVAEIDATRPGATTPASGGEDVQRTLTAIRRGITEVHSIAPCAVTLVPPGSLAKTTSGKLQRYVCRDAFLAGGLPILAQWIDDDVDVALPLERAAS
jgi:acyl-CoA synthetase (AMP-forming)/AMP-acid ligase II